MCILIYATCLYLVGGIYHAERRGAKRRGEQEDTEKLLVLLSLHSAFCRSGMQVQRGVSFGFEFGLGLGLELEFGGVFYSWS
jgi:hypothetical protein